MINKDSIERFKYAAKERLGQDFTDEEARDEIADWFDPTMPPPDLSDEQITEIIESMLGVR